jgi:hypothetical protein
MKSSLRLKLAYRRVRDELRDQPRSGRALVVNPFEIELVEVDYKGWIDELTRRVEGGSYVPGPLEVSAAPKGGGLVRPAVRLGIGDRVVYTAAVGACLRKILDETNWSQKKIDFALRLNSNPIARDWIRSPFLGWKEWRERSVRNLVLKKTRFVLTADIAGYFENISIKMLRSDLVRIGCPDDAVVVIGRCLNHWAATPDRGLPQGVLASDVLAKLYLEPFDMALKSEGYNHVRYVDDIRIFCRSRAEAQRALVLITRLLRERGLTLQSAKTEIHVAEDVRPDIEGVGPLIQDLHQKYIDDAITRGLMAADPSMPVSVIDDLANAQPHEMAPAVIRKAFRQYVLKRERPQQSMLRYTLNRLGALGDDLALEYCSELLLRQPESTTDVLKYFALLSRAREQATNGELSKPTGVPVSELERPLVRVLKNKNLEMYPYQRYLILGWLWRNGRSLRKPTLAAVRKLAFSSDDRGYVQVQARALLGRFGDYSDIERLAALFAECSDPLERAQVLCSLSRLEKGRRNEILGRVKTEAPWVCRAVRLVRAG